MVSLTNPSFKRPSIDSLDHAFAARAYLSVCTPVKKS